jgi:hypothetical protein
VRSVRRGSKVRQETVSQLGELDAEGRVAARELLQSFGGVDRQRRLFEEEPEAALVQVDVGKLRLERNRRFGDVWVAKPNFFEPLGRIFAGCQAENRLNSATTF